MEGLLLRGREEKERRRELGGKGGEGIPEGIPKDEVNEINIVANFLRKLRKAVARSSSDGVCDFHYIFPVLWIASDFTDGPTTACRYCGSDATAASCWLRRVNPRRD